MRGAAVTVPVPNCSGRGTPTCQGMQQSWGGHSLASARSPPLLVSPGQLHVPSTHAWGPAAALGGSLGTPTALLGVCTPTGSGSVWGGRAQRPAVRAGGGQVPLAGSRPPPARDPLPSHHWGCLGRGCPVVPSMAGCPPHLAICPRGGCVCPPTPCPGSSSRWDSRIMVLSTLDSLLFSNCCYRLGWGGPAEPPLHGDPRVLPPGGAGGLWPPGHAKLAFVCPRACRRGCGHPKTRGTPPQNCLGAGGVRGGHSPSPLSCSLGSGGARSVPCDPLRSVSSPPRCFCVSPPRGAEPL